MIEPGKTVKGGAHKSKSGLLEFDFDERKVRFVGRVPLGPDVSVLISDARDFGLDIVEREFGNTYRLKEGWILDGMIRNAHT